MTFMDQSVEPFTASLVVIDGFLPNDLAQAMRADLESHFSSQEPDGAVERQVWEIRTVPGLESYLQAQPHAVVAPTRINHFFGLLRTWSARNFGLAGVSAPTLDLFLSGNQSKLHPNSNHGRFTYQYFLTSDTRRNVGGETVLLREGDLFQQTIGAPKAARFLTEVVEPKFNRLVVFDSRLSRSVERVEGSIDPLEGRICLTGTIQEAGPIISGTLGLEKISPGLSAARDRFAADNQSALRAYHGPVTVRFVIREDGKPADLRILLDRAIPRRGNEAAQHELRSALCAALSSVGYPPASGPTNVILPVVFGGSSPQRSDAGIGITAQPSTGRWLNSGSAVLSRLATLRAHDTALIDDIMSSALSSGDLTTASEFAARIAARQRGSHWYQPYPEIEIPSVVEPQPFLTIPKLEHDIEQFAFLRQRQVLGAEFDPIISTYNSVLTELRSSETSDRVPMEGDLQDRLGHVFNRIVHIRPTPRVSGCALSKKWDRRTAEDDYLHHPHGLSVIDDFLSQDALRELRSFCLESTVWSVNRYGHGRLGAFFREGFNCPLLLQISEELREAFPHVIGDHPLEQIWGYKYAPMQPQTHPHADFAAVNVNFWLTPDEANLNPKSGGLVVYGLEAPQDWDFETYNSEGRIISGLIEEKKPEVVEILYRANRAIIFNSDLFHTTAPINFRDEYERRRINVTMLFGIRENSAERRFSL